MKNYMLFTPKTFDVRSFNYFYSEKNLLWNFDSNIEDKATIAAIISHECTHQWFGNLVTCKWWSELWLNEGLATYFEYEILKEVSD